MARKRTYPPRTPEAVQAALGRLKTALASVEPSSHAATAYRLAVANHERELAEVSGEAARG